MESTVRRNSQGANVRRWREWRNMNQDVLAEKIGTSQATLSAYEKKEQLDPEILEKIAKALDIPVEAITELEQGTSINIISGNWSDNACASNTMNAINNNPTFNPIDKIIELYNERIALYERMLKEKESVIELLQEIAKEKK